MQKLIRNPIFRIVGIIVVLYYGLFYNKQQPDSLSKRFAPDQIKNNLTEISSKSIDILSNLKKVEDIKKSLESQPIKEQQNSLEKGQNER
jgi:hypothetical protein